MEADEATKGDEADEGYKDRRKDEARPGGPEAASPTHVPSATGLAGLAGLAG